MRTLIDEMFDMVGVADHLKDHATRTKPAVSYRDLKEEGYEFLMVLPGLPKDEIELETKGRTLRVAYQCSPDTKAKINYGSFDRVWTLPNDADLEGVEAQHVDGILTIRVPRLASVVQTRAIAIG